MYLRTWNHHKQGLPPIFTPITRDHRSPSITEGNRNWNVEKYTFIPVERRYKITICCLFNTRLSFKTENWLNRKNIIRHSSTISHPGTLWNTHFIHFRLYIHILVALHSHTRLLFPPFFFPPSSFFSLPNPLPHVCYASSQRIISSRFRGTRRYKIVGTANCPPFKHNVNN